MHAIFSELKALENPSAAKSLAGFFKTGAGDYGEGDVFYGINVPKIREVVKKFAAKASLQDAVELLNSPVHECRLAGVLLLVEKFQRAGEGGRKEIYELYRNNARRVNNWDLVDASADKIVGAWLEGKDKRDLEKLARSENVWERRIAVVATLHFIKKGDCRETFKIAELLMRDEHDLIQKATGWMLREAGKRCSERALEGFLEKHAGQMPRTMLRYAIERMPEGKRKFFLGNGKPPPACLLQRGGTRIFD